MDGDVFRRDREAEAGSTGRACARGVRPVEAIKDVVRDLLCHSHSSVADAAGDVGLGRCKSNRDGRAVGVLNGVDNEVADDAFDAALINLGGDAGGGDDLDRDALALGEIGTSLDDASDDGTQVAFFCVQQGARCVVARDLEQVREHLFHAFGLVVQQLGGAARVRG